MKRLVFRNSVRDVIPSRTAAILVITAVMVAAASPGDDQASRDLTGVYRVISNETVLLGKLRNAGSPKEVALQPWAVEKSKGVDLKEEAGRICLPVGPFRMMAADSLKIELLPAPGALVMLYEDASHGHVRVIHMNRGHLAKLEPSWLGDNVGKWDKETLIVDTIGFDDRTWFNETGAQHSDAFHLIERIRPIMNSKYLEYRVTAEDPKALMKPYTYVRYFQKIDAEIQEHFCEPEE